MNGDFLDALQAIAKEREISADALLETVEAALVTAYKKNFAAMGDIKVRINTSNATFQVFAQKAVIEEGDPEPNEILLEDARKYDPEILPGEILEIEVTPGTVGRIDAQTAKQVLVQKIREQEREKTFEEFNERVGEVITGTVQRREYKNIFINMGKVEALLPPQEQVETEPYRFNDRLKLYMLEVRRTPKGPQVIVSRTHPSLIRRLFELEVPEIADGIVTIKSVAREPGARSKIAVFSRDEKVDPVGSCVGHRGSRVQAVVNELYDEKIDIVRWSPETGQFIAEALSPAKAVRVTVNEDTKSAFVVVPDNQLSLAIGKSGQNVRLAARLTGWRIDIRSESQVARATLIAATTPGEEDAAFEGREDMQAPVAEEAPVAAAVAPAAPPAAPEEPAIPVSSLSEDEADDSLPMIELPDILPDFSEEQDTSNGVGEETAEKQSKV
jgi:transcription termination/antitermination protein NusA